MAAGSQLLLAAALLLLCNATQGHEALYRVVVSRAYYTAFLAARDFVGLAGQSIGVHRKTINRLAQCPGHGRTTKGFMEDLFALRVLADYKTHETVTIDNAERSVFLCLDIISLVGLMQMQAADAAH